MFPRKRQTPLSLIGRGATVIALTMVVAFGAGCGEQTQKILQDGIDTLDRQPSAWDQTMRVTIERLSKERSDALDQVQVVYNSALGQAQVTAFCGADFIGRRLEQRLQAVLHSVNPSRPEPVIRPVICKTNPPEKVGESTQLVVYYGYDFKEFKKEKPFLAKITYKGGEVADPDFGDVAIATNYQLSVEFQAADFTKIDRTKHPKLVLGWGAVGVISDDPSEQSAALPIIISASPQPIYSYEDWAAQDYAASGVFSGYCTNINAPHDIQGGWTIDRSKGDIGHAGIHELEIKDNNQSRTSLRSYNYSTETDTRIKVTGRICGSAGKGPGAIFDRTYRIYTVKAG